MLTIKNGANGDLLHDEIFQNIWNEFAEVPPVDAPLLTTRQNSVQLPAMLAVRLSQYSMFLLEHPTIRRMVTSLDDPLSDLPSSYDTLTTSVKTLT